MPRAGCPAQWHGGTVLRIGQRCSREGMVHSVSLRHPPGECPKAAHYPELERFARVLAAVRNHAAKETGAFELVIVFHLISSLVLAQRGSVSSPKSANISVKAFFISSFDWRREADSRSTLRES